MSASRRQALVLLAGVLAAGRAGATPADAEMAIAAIAKGAVPRTGRVKLDIPTIAENGNTVPVTVTVESPMTAADHVTGIHLIAEANPLPNLVSFHFGPRAGKAEVSTRIRLFTTQTVRAFATMSDGSVWADGVEVLVTIAACIEGLD